ncbi:MAG: hypothetical protein QW416_05500 [Candidatus Nitrosocaldaceae archaeon]
MNSSIVTPIGTNPPVIEFFQYVESALDQRVTNLTTIEKHLVLEGLELVMTS